MMTPDIPENEESRLATLRSLDILDTDYEERFDRVTRIAKRLFKVPVALVSLIDENRQWFKSSAGLDVRETPRDISFCGHAIMEDKLFYIPDASKDPRFANNPLVTGPPNIRFYAGHPLHAPNGDIMGTLCIIDTEPKDLTEEDILTLEDLAGVVEQELATFLLATMDELTGVCNRRGFLRLAKHTISLCKRQSIPASLAYIDLNRFKLINDNYGHAEGDRALALVARQLEKCVRDSDVIARVGGDEFVVLITNMTAEAAVNLMQRISDALTAVSKTLNLDYELSLSYGLVDFDWSQTEAIDSKIMQADERMYERKKLSNDNHR